MLERITNHESPITTALAHPLPARLHPARAAVPRDEPAARGADARPRAVGTRRARRAWRPGAAAARRAATVAAAADRLGRAGRAVAAARRGGRGAGTGTARG